MLTPQDAIMLAVAMGTPRGTAEANIGAAYPEAAPRVPAAKEVAIFSRQVMPDGSVVEKRTLGDGSTKTTNIPAAEAE